MVLRTVNDKVVDLRLNVELVDMLEKKMVKDAKPKAKPKEKD